MFSEDFFNGVFCGASLTFTACGFWYASREIKRLRQEYRSIQITRDQIHKDRLDKIDASYPTGSESLPVVDPPEMMPTIEENFRVKGLTHMGWEYVKLLQVCGKLLKVQQNRPLGRIGTVVIEQVHPQDQQFVADLIAASPGKDDQFYFDDTVDEQRLPDGGSLPPSV
jgi:hypothetical protein